MGRSLVACCLLPSISVLQAAVLRERPGARHGGEGAGEEAGTQLYAPLLEMVDNMKQGRHSLNDLSNVTQCSARLATSPMWFPEPATVPSVRMPEGARGAVIVSWSERGTWHGTLHHSDNASLRQWDCQLQTVREYCKRHGYVFYIMNDTAEKEAEREQNGLRPYWLKVQNMRELLPKHAWVMHLDTDSMVPFVEESKSVEDVFAMAPANARNASLFVPAEELWNTDMVLVRNTDWGRDYLERVWALRLTCPMCVKGSEQCALELAMLQSAMQHQIEAGKPDLTVVKTTDFWKRTTDYKGQASCCLPTAFCHYPLGRSWPRNENADTRPMYCVGRWLNAYFHQFNAYQPLGWVSSGHPHIVWNNYLRQKMGLAHPVKTGPACECFKRKYENHTEGDISKQCRNW